MKVQGKIKQVLEDFFTSFEKEEPKVAVTSSLDTEDFPNKAGSFFQLCLGNCRKLS